MSQQLVNSAHGLSVNWRQLDTVVFDRERYLNCDDKRKIDESIKKREELMFLPTYLNEQNIQDVQYQKSKYKIVLMGVLRDGRKATVIIDDIEPFFEVVLDKECHKQQIEKICGILNESPNTQPIKKTLIEAKQFKGYQEDKTKFIRLYYNTAKARSEAIKAVRNRGFQTTTDDMGNYHRVVCRNWQTSFSTWAVLKNYEIKISPQFKGEVYRISIDDYKPYTGEITTELLRDKTMSCCWDIETWSEDKSVPQPNNPTDKMFCIGMTFQWISEKTPFLKIALCDFPAQEKKEYLTIVCENEQRMISIFATIFSRLKPEYIFGFNDSDYDWRWLIERAEQYPGCLSDLADKLNMSIPYKPYDDKGVKNWFYKKLSIKLDASSSIDGFVFQGHGFIPVDVRTVFRKLNPTSEQSSLKFFLEENKQNGKENMPYEKMFKIYTDYKKFMELRLVDFDYKDINNTISKFTEEDKKQFEQHKEALASVNFYCMIDAHRCHDLIFVRNIVMDKREVAKMTYVSTADAFYRADGVKVRNLTIAIGQRPPFNIRFTNIPPNGQEVGKYPGAFVFPPVKGMKISKLSIRERVKKAELLNSSSKNKSENKSDMKDIDDNLINKQTNQIEIKEQFSTWLNTSEEEIRCYEEFVNKHGATLTHEQIETIRAEGVNIPKKFEDFLLEKIGRPITGLDFASLYPSIVRTYNFSPEYCIKDKQYARSLEGKHKLIKVDFMFNSTRRVAYFIWHDGIYDPSKAEPGKFKFGVYPYILNDLFNKRVVVKKEMKKFEHLIEQFNLLPTEEQQKRASDIEDYKFNYAYCESKQRALKVFMNTFYGEAGNKKSPFFLLEVAGGITEYGKRNIKLAYAFVKQNDCGIYYGDTDSLYISIPEKHFNEMDRIYYSNQKFKEMFDADEKPLSNKIVYWNEMVELTFKVISDLNNKINEEFKKDNGTDFLSMAYEEVLYPSAWLAKKKYFGIAHVKNINFKPKSLFIRGLEIKKRGVSKLAKEVYTEIMWALVSEDNLLDPMEWALKQIDTIYVKQWTYQHFIQTGILRKGKKNVKLNTFAERMRQERGLDVPFNERFKFIIVRKNPYMYDVRGRKVTLKVGDRIEYAENAEREGMEIDLDYYMKGSIIGQLARLITYHEKFHVNIPDEATPEEQKKIEEKVYKTAVKYLNEYSAKYYAKYNTFGKAFKKVYTTVNKLVMTKLKAYDKKVAGILSADVIDKKYQDCNDVEEEDDGKEEKDYIYEWLFTTAKKAAVKAVKDYGDDYIKEKTSELKSTINKKYREIKKMFYVDRKFTTENLLKLKKDSGNCNEDISRDDSKDDGKDSSKDNDKDSKNQKPDAKFKELIDEFTDVKTEDEFEDRMTELKAEELKERKATMLKEIMRQYIGSASIMQKVELKYRNSISEMEKKYRVMSGELYKMYNDYNRKLTDMVALVRNKVNIPSELKKPTKEAKEYSLDDLDYKMTDEVSEKLNEKVKETYSLVTDDPKMNECINKIKSLYDDIYKIELVMNRHIALASHVKKLTEKKYNIVTKPKEVDSRMNDDYESVKEQIKNLDL